MAEKTTTQQYWQGVGRRKEAVARVRISKSEKQAVNVNEKSVADYFQDPVYAQVALESLERGSADVKFSASIVVKGGGKHAQAEAVRHAIARALLTYNPELRPDLKGLGYLTRDPRTRERKKFGLKRARRARQWRKR